MGEKFNFSTFPGVHANTRYRVWNSVVKQMRLAPAVESVLSAVYLRTLKTHTQKKINFASVTLLAKTKGGGSAEKFQE